MANCPHGFVTGYDVLREECEVCRTKACEIKSVEGELIISTPEVADLRRKEINSLLQNIEKSYFSVGKRLVEAREKNDHLALGFQTFESYVSEEFRMKKSTAYNLIDLYIVFGQKLLELNDTELEHFRPSRLYPVMKEAKEMDDGSIGALLEKSLALGNMDWQQEVNKIKGRPDRPLHCDHSELGEVVYYKCKACGKFIAEE